ncbi:MAG: class I mannose-6-phosphate isomerase [Planctomycetes bacterium]|nr:class I mannose-6-phosphate isomerase [Planctomycetota bacterium]
MEPLAFEPFLRPLVWGGRRLGELFGKPLPEGAVGESWEISAHPQHVSRVADGPLRGRALDDLCRNCARELFGDHPLPDGSFPLLIKLLDCRDWLSVQVHPNDEIAARLLPGERGKTEAWVVLEAEPEARIYAGLTPGTTQGKLESGIADGSVADCLHSFVPRVGDCLFLPAGTVHAVGGGVVIAEVQQCSDATFRLFDWKRVGLDGKPRPLHIREALESIDWRQGPVTPVTPVTTVKGTEIGPCGERLVRCPYFGLDRYFLEEAMELPARDELSIWMVIEGCARLLSVNGHESRCRRGDTIMLPATASRCRWEPAPKATMLRIAL